MCCAIAILGLIGPRALIVFWWLVEPARWSVTFGGSPLLPVLGLIFLPWTTVAYVLVWAAGGLSLFGWLVVALAFILDVGTYGGGFSGNRDRMSGYYRN